MPRELDIRVDTNPDADLSKADFGNEPTDDQAALAEEEAAKAAGKSTKPAAAKPVAAEKPDARPRDAQGRFVADGEGGEEEQPEEEQPEEEQPEEEQPEEEQLEEEQPEEEGEDKGPKNVPYSRFREVVEQRNASTLELAAAKAELVKLQAKDEDKITTLKKSLDGLYEKVEEARADAKTKEAAALQRQIDEANREISKIEAEVVSRRESMIATESTIYNGMLDQLEEMRPETDPNSEEFDRNVVKELEFNVQAYEKMGMTPSAALRRATALIFGEDLFGGRRARAPAKVEEKPAPKEKPASKKTNIAKNLDAQRRNGPSNERGGPDAAGAIKPIDKMTDDEFAALPESKKAELRGDHYVGE